MVPELEPVRANVGAGLVVVVVGASVVAGAVVGVGAVAVVVVEWPA